jgi:hypothetical protein
MTDSNADGHDHCSRCPSAQLGITDRRRWDCSPHASLSRESWRSALWWSVLRASDEARMLPLLVRDMLGGESLRRSTQCQARQLKDYDLATQILNAGVGPAKDCLPTPIYHRRP